MTHSVLNKYGTSFQIKVLSLLLTNKEYLINVRDMIEVSYFNDSSHQWITEFILKYFDKYHTTPSQDILVIENKKIENEVLKIGVAETLREAYKVCEDKDLPYTQEEFLNFCNNQQLKNALLQSIELLKMGAYDDIRTLINKSTRLKETKNLGHIYEKDVETRYRDDDRAPIPYPWKAFNDITQGGYGKGELILIFGSPKGGKSWVAIAMAAYAVSIGYNIIYYTLELSEGYVGKRFDAVFTKIAVDKLAGQQDKIQEMVDGLKGKLRIKEFAAGRASLDNLETHMNQLEQQEEFKPDAVFCDYLDLLKNRNVFRKEKKEDLDDVYTDARGLAREKRIPFISPSQVNRAGANDNVIEADKMAGSYGKAAICDFAVSLSRKKKDKIEKTGRFHVMANRVGIDGVTYLAKVDTSNGNINIDENAIDIDNEEEDGKSSRPSSNIGSDDRKSLFKKFQELKNN